MGRGTANCVTRIDVLDIDFHVLFFKKLIESLFEEDPDVP
jgi:hypothetical protein